MHALSRVCMCVCVGLHVQVGKDNMQKEEQESIVWVLRKD